MRHHVLRHDAVLLRLDLRCQALHADAGRCRNLRLRIDLLR
jgi:hypothetical protein